MITVKQILDQLRRFHYRRSIQDIETAITQLETGRFPRLHSFLHGGPVNGWPRKSVQVHLHKLRELKQRREAWLQQAKE